MENDPQIITKNDNNNNSNKNGNKRLSLCSENADEIQMNSSYNRTITQASLIPLSSTKRVTTNANSPKMGSRRIFTPQFKLQVLESYRNDNDCKGNQRATARKYNIHRRQIQKWLQCESNLRSSVANINHNAVKHQFHNVNMQQQQTKNVIIPSHSSVSSSSYSPSQLNSKHMSLDSTRESMSLNSVKMTNLPTYISTQSTQETHDIFGTTNLASSGTISIESPAVPMGSATSISPSGIAGGNTNVPSTISPLIHNHYGISPYSSIPSTAAVPILAQHMHHHLAHQPSYQYHNLSYSSTMSLHASENQQSSSYCTPISLPAINILATATSRSYVAGDAHKLDLTPIENKSYTNLISDKKKNLCNDNQFHFNYDCPEAIINPSSLNVSFPSNIFKRDSSFSSAYSFGPMDLSLPHRRQVKSELVSNIKTSSQKIETKIPERKEYNGMEEIDIVDLTYRKRRLLNISHSNDDFPEKQQKLSGSDTVLNNSTFNGVKENCAKQSTSLNEDEEIEIEVGMEEKMPPSSKPIKLFKPYLLDECESKDESCVNRNLNKTNKNYPTEQLEQIDTCFSNGISTTISSNNLSVRDNTFPNIMKKIVTPCVDNTNFLVECRSESPRSSCSPAASVPTLSPTNFHYPKGSPSSSGYESSTSTYSDSSSSSRNESYNYGQIYSVNLQMQSIYNENIHVIHPSKHVQCWLEKGNSKPLTANSSVALLV